MEPVGSQLEGTRNRSLYQFHGPRISIEDEKSNSVYRHDLQMYIDAPARGRLGLEVLRNWTFKRLEVLCYVAKVKEQKLERSLRLSTLLSLLECNDLSEFAMLYNIHSDCIPRIRQRLVILDSIAHFYLKTAFAFNDKICNWFIRQEVNLFEWRLSSLPLSSIRDFMELNDIKYPTISVEEKREIKEQLEVFHTPEEVEKQNFYKLHFTKVNKIVASGQVHLRSGTAYVPESKEYVTMMVTNEFYLKLNCTAAVARRNHAMISEDARHANLLSQVIKLAERYLKSLSNPSGITYDKLDALAEKSYPLCMRMIHKSLRVHHHLKNSSRVQYTLFLKGIGLPFEDALQLWKTEFCKRMTEWEFANEYDYYVKHLYGKVGRKSDYAPFECSKIIQTSPARNDCNGCPYKHMATPQLRAALREFGILNPDAEEIITLAQERKYTEACAKHYEAVHNVSLDAPFEHPNDYFRSSWEHFKEKEKTMEEDEEDEEDEKE